jgi:preprotein translocase subunit SecD
VAPSTKIVRETLPDIDKRPTEAAIGFFPRLSQAVIRFEVRLAETHAAAGLREARVARSDQLVYLHKDIIVTNGDIDRSLVVQGDGPSHFGVAVEFKAAGAEKIREATVDHIDGLVAILLNGDVVAVLRGPISTSALISGDYSRAEAERLVNGIGIR